MRSLAFLLTALALPAAACEGLAVENAWIRAAPPGATVRVGYATLVNRGKAALSLDRVSSAQFGAVEIHQTTEDRGVARMRRLETLEMAAGATVTLRPGGKHLMLFRPASTLAAGDRARLNLHCGAAAVSFTFPVLPAP